MDRTPPDKGQRVNEDIRAPKVRVVSEDGEQLGIMNVKDAIEAARNRDLDLVEVAPKAEPPVCKIMDFGKFRYIQKKRQQEAKKKQSTVQVKEIKFRPKIEEHDYDFKVKHIIRFLKEGNKVKVTVMFRGREMAHKELGAEILDRVAEEVKEYGVIESETKFEGRNMVAVLGPVKNKALSNESQPASTDEAQTASEAEQE